MITGLGYEFLSCEYDEITQLNDEFILLRLGKKVGFLVQNINKVPCIYEVENGFKYDRYTVSVMKNGKPIRINNWGKETE